MEEKKKTGIGHDDDGNVDDKRVAGWILLVTVLCLSVLGLIKNSETAVELVSILVWPAVIPFGITVTEKFGRKNG